MDIDKLFKLFNNYIKRRETFKRMPMSQKHIVQKDYEQSKVDLENEINAIIDNRIIEHNLKRESSSEPVVAADPIVHFEESSENKDNKEQDNNTGNPTEEIF